MSCNGCRVLRKGCSEDCVLRPCLEWINSPESQANATLFLAKFYGRAGLINLINSVPLHLRPDTFKSLFYEACGRIIDPIYGSVGLMSSGNWPRCEAAVEAVLQGSPLMMQGQFDIRHISRLDSSVAARRSRVRARQGCKRSRTSSDSKVATEFVINQGGEDAKFTITGWEDVGKEYYDEYHLKRTQSHDSVETVEPELVDQEMFFGVKMEPAECYGIELELTLGINPLLRRYMATVVDISDGED